MAEPLSPLRTNRNEPSLFDKLSTAAQITPEQQYEQRGAESQFAKGLRSGAAGLTANSFASEALRAEVAGEEAAFTEARDRAMQTSQGAQMYAPRVTSLRDIGGVNDAADFAAGAIGQGAMSMAPSLAAAALTRGRGVAGKMSAFGGAMVPAYEQERGEAALGQYQDPALAQAPLEERDRAATVKGGINAALESIVPAGLGSSLLRKPAGSLLGHVARDAATEGATEGAQTLVGFGAEKYLDNKRELDPWDVADAIAAGALSGGAMSGAARGPGAAAQAILDKAPTPSMPEIRNPFATPTDPAAQDPGVVTDIGPDPDAPPDGPGLMERAAGLGQAVNERFGEDFAAAGEKVVEGASKAKDFVSDTVDRMTEAVKTAENPGDFLSQVFGGNLDEDAAQDISDEPNPALRGATFEETEANIARDDEARVERAARYATDLMDDPATPEATKQRVAAMQGDFTNPDNQAFVARNLVAQRGGQRVAKAAQDIVDLGKELAKSAKNAVGDAANRITKQNLQSASPSERAAFEKVIFDNLTDEAKSSTFVRSHMADMASTLMAFAAKTGDITAKDLPTLSRLSGAMSVFKDPDAVAAQLVEYGAIPRDAESFLSRIKSIQSARSDMQQPNSFLYSALTPEAQERLTQPMLKRIAELVDTFSIAEGDKRGDKVIDGLAQAFGSREAAQAVLDYYARQNKANVKFDENEAITNPDGGFQETGGAKAGWRFKDAKTLRPYFKGSKDIDAARRDGVIGDAKAKKASLMDYVIETDGDAEAEVTRIIKDIEDRIAQHEARKGEDRSEIINALRGEKYMVQDAYTTGGSPAALSLYEVLRTEPKEANNLVANDEDLNSFSKQKRGSARVTFTKTDGKKLMLSAESMWKTVGDKERATGQQGGEGESARARRLFSEAVASVLARDDISGLETPMEEIYLGDMAAPAVREKPDPKKMAAMAKALDDASGSLDTLKRRLDLRGAEFESLLEKDDWAGGQRGEAREDILDSFQQYIDAQQVKYDELLRQKFTMPARAVIRERIQLTRQKMNELKDLQRDVLRDERDEQRPGFVENKPKISRTREEMDTSGRIRNAEEDTGKAVGTGGAPAMREPAPKDLPTPKPKPVRKKAETDPAASSRDTARKIDDTRAVSEDAFTALHDVIVKDQYSRLDTPNKVIKFAALAKKAYEQLKKTPALERTEQQEELLDHMDDLGMFDKDTGFDWDMLMSELDAFEDSGEGRKQGREAYRQLHNILGEEVMSPDFYRGDKRPKAELGTTQQRVTLSGSSPYLAKDQAKSDKANKFIGRGSVGSSTAAYARSWGDRANTGVYAADDNVFISVNGNRPGALSPDFVEIKRAMSAGATLITDGPADRARPFNTGERAVAEFLSHNGYAEKSSGEWAPAKKSAMAPKKGRPGKIDRQAVLDEIERIRGPQVKVLFQTFGQIGASGEFSMNKDKTGRLIKIAINSLSPMSVAWHESLHDFMAMLGGDKAERKLKSDLLAAAEAPHVMAKLRKLLEGHPKAIEQIESDREERLAYMYQFWAEGLLPLGPTGNNIFSRFARFIREMLGVLSQDQKIDQLFTALHTGEFSQPNLVAAVLEDLKAQTLGDKLRAVSGPIGDLSETLFTGATDRLRNTNIDALTELADMFHREPGREIHNAVNKGAKPSFVSSVDSIGRKAAEARLAAGEDAEKVFADTKWFKDAQGKMVREIDDSRLFKAAWGEIKRVVATNEGLLKVFDAVLDGEVESLGSMSLAKVLEDMGLPHMAAKVGGVQIELSSDEESHIVRNKNKIVAVKIGIAQALSGEFSKLPIEERKNAVANVGALTVLHELQHVLQTLDERTDGMFDGEYSKQLGEIEAFDVEARYVARYVAEKLGGEELSLPELAKKVSTMAGMEHSDFAASVSEPMFVKQHSARKEYRGGGATNELPFLQRRSQQVGKRLNQLQDILADTTATDRRTALENLQSLKTPSTPLEKDLSKYLKGLFKYMEDSGVKRYDAKSKAWVPMRQVKEYFPRVWDKVSVRNNEAEFMKLFEQYVPKDQARNTYNAIVNGDGALDLAENEHALGFTPWNRAVLERNFTFIDKTNAAAFAKFQVKDMADILTTYTQQAVHRAEYAKSFGNNGEVITQMFLDAQQQGATPEELAMARKATMAMEGTLGHDFNPRLKEVMSGIQTYQNIVLLPLSLFSNLIDPLGVAMRSNDMKEAFRAFVYGIKGIADQIRGAGPDAETELARTIGLIDDQNMLEAMGHVYNSMHMSPFLKKINSKFFRYNGMEMWNQRMRVAAMMAAQRFIITQADILKGNNHAIAHGGNATTPTGDKNSAFRYLEELGIDPVTVFVTQNGTLAITEEQLLAAGAPKSTVQTISKKIQEGVFKWVDGAVLRPNAAHRPIWGSDPRYQLIMHLKQFTFSFQNTILRRVGEEMRHGNNAPAWILASYVPFMFLSDVMKGTLTGTIQTTSDLYDVASQSIARSGILGTGVFGVDAMEDVDRGKTPGTSFLGPSFGHLSTLLSGVVGNASGEQVIDRSVPFAKYL